MNQDGNQNTPVLVEKSAGEPKPETALTQWRPQDADREYFKATIRNRVRNARVSEGTIFKPAKPKPKISDTGEKMVAVYARVSTKSKEQVSSIENQTRYYTEKIEQTPNWHMQHIYSDEGKSGTSMKKRKQFLKMLQDAADRKMDLILCASVSRFARNVSDCIEQVRQLRVMNPSHPVGVYFETENIYTLDPDSNQLLSIHAMLAEWESANKSRRMILSYDQRICTGQYPVLDLLGYRHTEDGGLIIHEDEAKTVRYIFLAFVSGYSYQEIADVLTEKERPTLKGRTEWNANMVRSIMSNERRWGDLSARKTIVIDYKERKTRKNDDERDAAYVPNHHEPIVSPEIARAAQMVAASRCRRSGIRDVGVIEQGLLKGFVSISPYWSGIDNASFHEICKGVYFEDEYTRLEHAAAIRRGEEHATVLSMNLTGYEVPPSAYFIGRDTPTITISKKRIAFSKGCFDRLKQSLYVEILYHPILQAIVVRACDEDAVNAICTISTRTGKRIMSVRAPAFAAAIYEKMNWLQDYDFRFKGVCRERGSECALIFYLDEPQILVGKKAVELTEEYGTDEAGACFIPIRRRTMVAYPEEWEKHPIGISYELRKQRDRLIDSLTSSDIREPSAVVMNPLIGELPSREEILEEVDQLLISM